LWLREEGKEGKEGQAERQKKERAIPATEILATALQKLSVTITEWFQLLPPGMPIM